MHNDETCECCAIIRAARQALEGDEPPFVKLRKIELALHPPRPRAPGTSDPRGWPLMDGHSHRDYL